MFGFAESTIIQWGMVSLMVFLFGIFFLCRALPIAVTLRRSEQERRNIK